MLIQQNEMGGKRKLAAAAKQLEQVQSRIAELSRYIKRLYEDNVNGKISDERFVEMSADYLSQDSNIIKGFLFLSDLVSTLTSGGNCIKIL